VGGGGGGGTKAARTLEGQETPGLI